MIEIGDTRDATVGERAAQDQQARLTALEFQQAANALLGHQRPHSVLGALQRGDADQELVGSDPGEIIIEIAGRDLRG